MDSISRFLEKTAKNRWSFSQLLENSALSCSGNKFLTCLQLLLKRKYTYHRSASGLTPGVQWGDLSWIGRRFRTQNPLAQMRRDGAPKQAMPLEPQLVACLRGPLPPLRERPVLTIAEFSPHHKPALWRHKNRPSLMEDSDVRNP